MLISIILSELSLKTLLKSVSILILLLIAATIVLGHPIYLIYGQPTWELSPNEPFPTIIYDLDTVTHDLKEIWNNDSNNQYTNSILIFDKEQIVIVVEGLTSRDRFHIISMAQPDSAILILIDRDQKDFKFHIYKNRLNELEVDFFSYDQDKNLQSQSYSLSNGKQLEKSNNNLREILLSGITPYQTPNSDIVPAEITGSGSIILRTDISLNFPNLPNELIPDESMYWNLIANNTEYSAILSVPNHIEGKFRQLYIYNRSLNKWDSVMIEGLQTRIRIVNNWLVGIIADPDPRTSFKTRTGYPPLLREDVIIINPFTAHQFVVHLGANAEVLWIDDTEVYFRIDNSLYKARIENDDFIDRELLLTDDKVRHIHWAFKGTSQPTEKKTKPTE